MKPGTVVRLPDGRVGTVVYHGLDGYGIKWGEHEVTEEELGGGSVFDNRGPPPRYKWLPDAMLRDPNPCIRIECVGEVFSIVPNPSKARRNAEIVRRREDGETYESIARIMGVSRERVRQIAIRDRDKYAVAV